MAFNEALAERIRQGLARKKGVEEKKMFGGVGFLLKGNMLVGVWKDSLIVRLGPDEGYEALREPYVKEFDITGRPIKGWVPVEPEGVEGDDQLAGWIQRAVTFVGGSAVVAPSASVTPTSMNICSRPAGATEISILAGRSDSFLNECGVPTGMLANVPSFATTCSPLTVKVISPSRT